MGQFLYCVPAVLCHSGSLDLPTENCLGAQRAVNSSTSTPKYAPGQRLREHQNRGTGNRDESCSQNVTTCSGAKVGWNDPPHLFPKRVQM